MRHQGPEFEHHPRTDAVVDFANLTHVSNTSGDTWIVDFKRGV